MNTKMFFTVQRLRETGKSWLFDCENTEDNLTVIQAINYNLHMQRYLIFTY